MDSIHTTAFKITRKTYDTGVQLLYASNREYLLPKEFQASIPDSTKSDWRILSAEKFAGHQYVKNLFEDGVQQKELYLDYKRLKSVHNAMTCNIACRIITRYGLIVLLKG